MLFRRAANARSIGNMALALIALSLSLKYLILAGGLPLFEKDAALRHVETAMRDGGFKARIDQDIPFVLAEKGGCQAKLRIISAHGTARHALASIDLAVGPTQYHYRGEWREKAPKFRPLVAYYIQRELARVRIYRSRMPVIAGAVSPECGRHSSALPNLTAIRLGVGPKATKPR